MGRIRLITGLIVLVTASACDPPDPAAPIEAAALDGGLDARAEVDAQALLPPDYGPTPDAGAEPAAIAEVCAADRGWYALRVAPIVERDCAACHRPGGLASESGSALVLASVPDASADVERLARYAAWADGATRLLLKPLGRLEHGGGARFAEGDQAHSAFIELVERFADPGSCDAPPALEPPPSPLRRLTAREYRNTVRDLFPSVELPPLSLPEPTIEQGFANAVDRQAPSEAWVEGWRSAAVIVTAAVAPHFGRLSPCVFDAPGCPQTFVDHWGARIFRRPVTAEEARRYTGFMEAMRSAHDGGIAARLTLQAMLQAPPFLYRLELDGAPDGAGAIRLDAYGLANRLSYFLWGTMPDEALFAAAESGALDTEDGLRFEIDRMLEHWRARGNVVAFARQWLDVDRIRTVNKDPERYPAFGDALVESMAQEVDRFVERTIFDGDGTLRALLTSTRTEIDAALAEIYGVEAPVGWGAVQLDPSQRAGLLTQANMLAAHGHFEHPSPVLRGVFVLERLLCARPPPPDGSIDTTPPSMEAFDYPTTNRERYAANSAGAPCSDCHRLIDGVGFAFEQYDSIGAWRAFDNGLRVDTGGALRTSDVAGPLADAVDLAHRLAESEQVADCFVRHWYRFARGRYESGADGPALATARAAFLAADGDVRALMRSIAMHPDFRRRPATPAEEAP